MVGHHDGMTVADAAPRTTKKRQADFMSFTVAKSVDGERS